MQWLLELETERDPISTCRLMNIFRRKGVNIVTLSLKAGPAEFSMKALVETAESEVAHLFNFLVKLGSDAVVFGSSLPLALFRSKALGEWPQIGFVPGPFLG